jgi:hypothetical protein
MEAAIHKRTRSSGGVEKRESKNQAEGESVPEELKESSQEKDKEK